MKEWRDWAIELLNTIECTEGMPKYSRLSQSALQIMLSSVLTKAISSAAELSTQSKPGVYVWEYLSPTKQWLPFDSDMSTKLELKYFQLRTSWSKRFLLNLNAITYLVDFSNYTLQQNNMSQCNKQSIRRVNSEPNLLLLPATATTSALLPPSPNLHQVSWGHSEPGKLLIVADRNTVTPGSFHERLYGPGRHPLRKVSAKYSLDISLASDISFADNNVISIRKIKPADLSSSVTKEVEAYNFAWGQYSRLQVTSASVGNTANNPQITRIDIIEYGVESEVFKNYTEKKKALLEEDKSIGTNKISCKAFILLISFIVQRRNGYFTVAQAIP